MASTVIVAVSSYDKMSLTSTSYKLLKNPIATVLVYLVLQRVIALFLMRQASSLTGFFVTTYHFHKLPVLMREIRSQFVYSLVVFLCVFVMSRITPYVRLRSIGLTGRLSLAYFTVGLAAQVAIAVVLALLVDRHGQILASLYACPKLLAFQVLVWCLLIGICEEITFRGCVLQVLETRWGSAVALGLSSVFFGLVHFQNPGETTFEVVDVVLSGGLPYAAAYLMTRSLWLPIGLHCGWDFVMILLHGDKAVPRAVPQTDSLVDLVSLDDVLQIILGIIFVLVAMRTGRWVGNNPLAPAKPFVSSAPTSSAE